MAGNKYHKFRGGERCDECGARQWFAQDAIRYCRNGHRLEGFASHEADEDDFGTQGKVSRKKKEARRKVAVKLAGDEGRELYLEVVQLILIRQVRWLVDVQGFPADFAELVKALWTLRVRNLPLRERGHGTAAASAASAADEEGQGHESDGSRPPSSSSAAAWFSSQSETDASSSDGNLSDATTARSWAPDARERWKLPKLVDTLALCYVGCLVRRLPISTADFHSWAQKGELEFLTALNQIPRNVRDRLPAEYHRALQVRDHLPLGRLQNAVQQLVLSLKINFDMAIPPLNHVPIMIRFIVDLVLPIDTYTTAECIADILNAKFTYINSHRRIRTIENPEVLLASLVVVSAKLSYSLDGVERCPINQDDPRRTKVDWQGWRKVINERSAKGSARLTHGDEHKVRTEHALAMDKTKLDDYIDWFERMWLGGAEPKTTERIQKLFKQERSSPIPDESPNPEADRDARTKRRYERLSHLIQPVSLVPESKQNEKAQARNLCPIWRTEADLPEAAKTLYSKAAELAAIPLSTLIQGAMQVERQLEVWCIRKTKEDNAVEMDARDEEA